MLASAYAAVMPRVAWQNAVYAAVSLAALLLLRFSVNPRRIKESLVIVAWYAVFTGAPLVMAIARGEFSTFYFWMLGINSILASIAIRELPVCKSLSAARILLVAATSFAIYIATEDRAAYDSGEIIGGSSNLLTAMLIGVVCWHSYSAVLAGRRAPIAAPVALLSVSVVFGGRSGILVAAMLLSLNIGLRVLSSRGFALAATAAAIAVIVVVPIEIFTDVVASTRLIHGFTDDIRSQMFSEYVGTLDALNFFIGAPYNPSGVIASYGDNPHNSVIRAHHLFGLPALLVLAGIYLAALARVIAKPATGSIYAFVLGNLVLLRSLYDSVYLWFEMDFILLSLFLSPAVHRSASGEFFVPISGVPPQGSNKQDMPLATR